MKTLLILMVLATSMTSAYAAKTSVEGPRVTGNGGGGVKRNGVYKTFYSAGIYINPEEVTDIPGADLYTKTITSLSGQGESTFKLLSSALPIGERKFYNIAEDKMDDTTMSRLIEEYARIVKQPANDLALFAITDIGTKTTYLLPSFYKLSENEQASILFHEAYWLLNPQADYSQVVTAEMAFQEFLEVKESGKYSHKLPRILGKLLNDPSFSLKSAFEADRIFQTAKNIIDSNGIIRVGALFLQNKNFCKEIEYSIVTGYTAILDRQKREDKVAISCKLNSVNLKDVILFQQKNSQSYFFQELVNYITVGNSLTYAVKDLDRQRSLTEEHMNKRVDFKLNQYESYGSVRIGSGYDNDVKYERTILIK